MVRCFPGPWSSKDNIPSKAALSEPWLVNRSLVNDNCSSPLGFFISAHSKGLKSLYKPFRMNTYARTLQVRILKDLRDFLSDAVVCPGQRQRPRVRLGRNGPDAEVREASASTIQSAAMRDDKHRRG